MTEKELMALRERIRQEAAGLTLKQVDARLVAAESAAARPGAGDLELETHLEWYAISFVMHDNADGPWNMRTYDPAKDGRPL